MPIVDSQVHDTKYYPSLGNTNSWICKSSEKNVQIIIKVNIYSLDYYSGLKPAINSVVIDSDKEFSYQVSEKI